MSQTVSLDPYRTEGVQVFAGRNRGRLVGESIRDQYGPEADISVPDDVISISRGFQYSLKKVLPNASFPDRFQK